MQLLDNLNVLSSLLLFRFYKHQDLKTNYEIISSCMNFAEDRSDVISHECSKPIF
ncbi:hypothetical protein ACRRTK_010448 [Alexandromys fortis]